MSPTVDAVSRLGDWPVFVVKKGAVFIGCGGEGEKSYFPLEWLFKI